MDNFMQMPMSNVPFIDTNAIAQNQADMARWQQQQQLAQAMMGAPLIPHGGRGGAIAGALTNFLGMLSNNRNNDKLSDILKTQFDIQNQGAQAKRKQDLEDEYRKMQEDIYKSVQSARGTAQANKEFAKPEFTGGGVFDPSTGGFTANQDWMNQQLALKSGEAKIAAANRQGPADPFRDIKAGVQAGLITPEQAQAAMRTKLLGGGVNAPSGYRATADGSLEAIPGGPADPNQPRKPQPLTAEATNKLALIDNAIANATKYRDRTVGKGGEFNDITSMTGDTPQLIRSAVQDMLYAKSGASAPAAEVEKATEMYAPSRVMGIPTERDSTASAKVQNFLADMQRMRDQITQGTIAQGQAMPGSAPPSAQPTQTAVNAQGQRIGLVNGQWVPL